jgi:lysyl-tRNA synthetase class 2
MYPFDAKFQEKVAELRAAGVDPYPTAAALEVSHLSTELHALFVGVENPVGDPRGAGVRVGGRLLFRNRMGKLLFLRLQDRGEPSVPELDAQGAPVLDDSGEPIMRGGLIQVMVQRDIVGEDAFELLKKLDIGDFVWARGDVVRTKTGELTVQATQARLAAKIVAPFPDRFHQLTDPETRFRQRYVDLFINDQVRQTFRTRSKVIRSV